MASLAASHGVLATGLLGAPAAVPGGCAGPGPGEDWEALMQAAADAGDPVELEQLLLLGQRAGRRFPRERAGLWLHRLASEPVLPAGLDGACAVGGEDGAGDAEEAVLCRMTVLSLLVRAGADVNHEDSSFQAPLHLASREAVRALEAGCEPALAHLRLAVVGSLLALRAEPDAAWLLCPEPPLRLAARCGDGALCRLLLDAGADSRVTLSPHCPPEAPSLGATAAPWQPRACCSGTAGDGDADVGESFETVSVAVVPYEESVAFGEGVAVEGLAVVEAAVAVVPYGEVPAAADEPRQAFSGEDDESPPGALCGIAETGPLWPDYSPAPDEDAVWAADWTLRSDPVAGGADAGGGPQRFCLTTEEDNITRFLRNCGLSMYIQPLMSYGLDSMEILLRARDETLKRAARDVGMQTMHYWTLHDHRKFLIDRLRLVASPSSRALAAKGAALCILELFGREVEADEVAPCPCCETLRKFV